MERYRREKGTMEAKVFEFKWKVKRFFADCKNVGDYYDSPMFPVRYPDDATQWFIRVYPRGFSTDSQNYVSIFLHFSSKQQIMISLDIAFTILSEQNKLLSVSGVQNFTGSEGRGGWIKFKKHSEVKDFTHCILDEFAATITCGIIAKKTVPHLPETFRRFGDWIDKIKTGFTDFEQLLDSSCFSDVTFIVEGKEIKLHKAILSCRCPVFQAMFEHEMKENIQNKVQITDISYKVMMELLRFIYAGKVEDMDGICELLLVAADKYQVMELKSQCQQSIYDQLSEDLAVSYLKRLENSSNIHFVRIVINYAAANYKVVVKKRGFAGVSSRIMHQILLAIADNDAE